MWTGDFFFVFRSVQSNLRCHTIEQNKKKQRMTVFGIQWKLFTTTKKEPNLQFNTAKKKVKTSRSTSGKPSFTYSCRFYHAFCVFSVAKRQLSNLSALSVVGRAIVVIHIFFSFQFKELLSSHTSIIISKCSLKFHLCGWIFIEASLSQPSQKCIQFRVW